MSLVMAWTLLDIHLSMFSGIRLDPVLFDEYYTSSRALDGSLRGP